MNAKDVIFTRQDKDSDSEKCHAETYYQTDLID